MATKRVGLVLALVGQLSCVRVVCGQGSQPEQRIYFWKPSTEDVPKSDTAERTVVLTFLLRHATSKKYRVLPGDGLDSIIRAQFFVYRKNHPNAYRLYEDEILRRNKVNPAFSIIKKYWLMRGKQLVLPSGPKFAALELSTLVSGKNETKYKARASRGFGTARTLSNKEFNDRLMTNFGFFAGSTAEIVNRGIAYAVNETKFAGDAYSNYEPVEFDAAPPEATPKSIARNSWPSVLPAVANQDIQCGSCTHVEDVLRYSGDGKEAARLFIADTGVSKSLNVPAHQLLYPKAKDREACSDLALKQHGTFVYSETAKGASLFGVLPQSKVFITKWAVPFPEHKADEEPYKFRLIELQKAISAINDQLSLQDPTTAVVNISASGPASSGETIPWLKASNRILFVAAAGNDKSDTITDSILFAQQGNMTANILIVGALNEKGVSRADYSNYKLHVDLFVQGSCVCGHGSEQLNGTSQAAPIAAVAAAILAGSNRNWNPIDVKWRLISTSTYEGTQGLEGQAVGGKLDFTRAMTKGIIVMRKAPASDVGPSGPWEEEADEIAFDNKWRQDWERLLISKESREVLRLTAVTCPPRTMPGTSCFVRMTLGKEPDSSGIAIASEAEISVRVADKIETITAGEIQDLILPIYSRPQDGKLSSLR